MARRSDAILPSAKVKAKAEAERDGLARPLRIMHVLPGLTLGGAETLLYRLVQRDSGFEHHVVCMGRREWYSDKLEALGIRVDHLEMYSPAAAVRGTLRLGRLMRDHRPDLIKAWMYRAFVVSGILSGSARIPTVWSIHCSSLTPIRLGGRLFAYAGGVLARWIPDFVINCSRKSAELHAKLGYSTAPGAVVHNGYDPEAFFPDEEARMNTRRAFGMAPETFLVASIGRWSVQKDFPNLLAALRRALDAGVPLRCLLVGPELEPANGELMKPIWESGCEDVVVPLGPRPDIQDIDRAIDLHVLASMGGEAFPNVVAETMLSGTPNVVTDVGDSGMMVGDTGWTVPIRDPQKLGDAIVAAWRERSEEPKHWEKRRLDARKRIADNFTFEKMAEAYEETWRRIALQPRRLNNSSSKRRANVQP